MTSEDTINGGIQINRPLLLGGGVSVAFGSLLVALGILLAGTAFLSAARRWARHLDKPTRETARLRFHQLRHATREGAKAWQGWTSSDVAANPGGIGLSPTNSRAATSRA
jgi:hypothetical protein